jgi:hypothetical protein
VQKEDGQAEQEQPRFFSVVARERTQPIGQRLGAQDGIDDEGQRPGLEEIGANAEEQQ